MAKLSEKIYGNIYAKTDPDFVSARKTLVHEIARAKSIEIYSAYYGIDFLLEVFGDASVKNRRSKELYLLFGRAAPAALADQRRGLDRLRQGLLDINYSKNNIEIAVSSSERQFHSKIYRFKGGNQTILVGSANASFNGFQNNDELMVCIHGHHKALDTYMDSAWDASDYYNEVKDTTTTPIQSFQDLLRDGYLYFQPTRTLGLGIDCFAGDEFKTIAALIRQRDNEIPFVDETSVTTNILLFLSINFTETRGEDALTTAYAKRLQLPTYSVQTAFGYWVPRAYQPRVEAAIEDAASERMQVLQGYLKSIIGKDEDFRRTQFAQLRNAVNNRLEKNRKPRLTKKQEAIIYDRLDGKIQRLRQQLSDQKVISRLSRRLIGTPVPELWEDDRSASELITSFLEDLSYKLGGARKERRIIAHLAKRFDLAKDDDIDDLSRKIDRYFKNQGSQRQSFWNET